jgi:hypothetical protein
MIRYPEAKANEYLPCPQLSGRHEVAKGELPESFPAREKKDYAGIIKQTSKAINI